jgi:hypothetical protein
MNLEKPQLRKRTKDQTRDLLARLSPGFLSRSEDPRWHSWTDEILLLRRCCKDRLTDSTASDPTKREYAKAYRAYYSRCWLDGFRLPSHQQQKLLEPESIELVQALCHLHAAEPTATETPRR